MINVVMLVKDRPKLTEQSLNTLHKNTQAAFCLTIIDDGSLPETKDIVDGYGGVNVCAIHLPMNDLCNAFNHVTGKLRNYGVQTSRHMFGQGDWLYLADNDSYFTPGWDQILIAAYERNRNERFLVIGGSNHHYHQPIGMLRPVGVEYLGYSLREYNALAGTSHLMKWATWDRFGPLRETGAAGPCQSEDTAFCADIVAAGGRVGAVWPEVVYDCGITQTGGAASPGAATKRRYEGVYYE